MGFAPSAVHVSAHDGFARPHRVAVAAPAAVAPAAVPVVSEVDADYYEYDEEDDTRRMLLAYLMLNQIQGCMYAPAWCGNNNLLLALLGL